MTRYFAVALVLLGVLAPATVAQPAVPPAKPAAVKLAPTALAPPAAPQPDAPPDKPTVVKLATSAPGKKTRALKYPLLPEPLDLKPGNAATFWRRAGRIATAVQHKYDPKEDLWSSAPLKDLPRKEIRDYLALYTQTLRLADQAARCDHCDWELPRPTFQNYQDLPLDEVQMCRQIARALDLRCRLQLSEGKIDDAIYTLQTGFALARNVGDGDTLIQNLVGIAIASIMFGRVEELMQLPGSPNLFWSLTALPTPFVDIRRSLEVELNTIFRSFPQLRELERDAAKKSMSAKETEKLVDEFLAEWWKITGGSDKVPAWGGRAALSLAALKVYPDAKKYLADQGYTKDEIEALPVLQAVIVYYLDEYSQTRDDILKWANAPPWQAQLKFEQIANDRFKAMRAGNGNPIIGLLMPAVSKVYEAQMRTDHLIGRLRCAEALRLYAAAHDGKAPAKFADVGDLPLPIDPYTGKGFDGFYQVKDGLGVLDIPAHPPQAKSWGRRYELGKSAGKE